MKTLSVVACLFLMLAITGCGSEEPSNMLEGIDQSEYASYEEMVAADEAMMSQEDESGGTGEVEVAE